LKIIFTEIVLYCFQTTVGSNVEDPGCLSRIPEPEFYPSRIPDLGSRISDPGYRIPDPKTATKERGVVMPFFVATNFTN
jgi:hypothetical protein